MSLSPPRAHNTLALETTYYYGGVYEEILHSYLFIVGFFGDAFF